METNETRLLMNVWIKGNDILVCYRSVWTNEWVNEWIDGKLNHDWPSKCAAKPLATSAISWLVEDREIFRSDPSVFLKENKTKDSSVFLKEIKTKDPSVFLKENKTKDSSVFLKGNKTESILFWKHIKSWSLFLFNELKFNPKMKGG